MTRGPVRLDVAVSYALPRTGLPAAVSFRKWVAAALKGRIREADLAIRVVDSKEGQSLNRHYRGKDYATNVLSVLHLLGWDHEDDKEADAMEQLEREILAELGIADPYAGER